MKLENDLERRKRIEESFVDPCPSQRNAANIRPVPIKKSGNFGLLFWQGQNAEQAFKFRKPYNPAGPLPSG